MLYNGSNGKRYAPGKRRNSFYMDIPEPKEHEEWMEVLDKHPGYTYHIDDSGKTLVREWIE